MQSKRVLKLATVRTPQAVKIEARPFALECSWSSSDAARAVVLVANRVDSSAVDLTPGSLTRALQRAGFGVLTLSSATMPSEGPPAPMTRFETGLLAARIVRATDWLLDRPGQRVLGCLAFGAGAASAVTAAVERPAGLRALVVVEPRLSFVDQSIQSLTAPTLLIVGQKDAAVMSEAHAAARQAPGRTLEVRAVPGRASARSHIGVREMGTLAQGWFQRHLR